METATRESESEMKTFLLLTDILNSLGSDLNTTSARNKELLSSVMYRLANSQSSVLDSEIQSEYSVRKNHEILRAESSELVFLSKTNKNCVLVKTLLGFAKLEISSELQNLSPARLYALCTAYEAILSMKHSLVTTAPAVMRNVMLYKITHSRQLLDMVGAPSGGTYFVLDYIIKSELPKLFPPTNDFVSCDDNLQVKRVISSSKLKEGHKFTVKVVDSHVNFQNNSDKQTHVLKKEENKPVHWLKKPDKPDVDEFENKLPGYEIEGRKVRSVVVGCWMSDELGDLKENRDPVAKLTRLRRSRPEEQNLYPCPSCGGEGINICTDQFIDLLFLN